MSNPELCCNCAQWDTCKAEGALPNDYCGMYQPLDEWISVEERLPEWDTDKLVWYEYFRYGEYNCMFQTYGIGHYIQEYGQWFGDDLNGTKVKVLYWRELPEPPKEKSDELQQETH